MRLNGDTLRKLFSLRLAGGESRIAHIPPSEQEAGQPYKGTHSINPLETQLPETTSQQTMRIAFRNSTVALTPPHQLEEKILGKSETPRVAFKSKSTNTALGATVAQGRAGFAVQYHTTPNPNKTATPAKPVQIKRTGLAEKTQQPFLGALLVQLRYGSKAQPAQTPRSR
jgi:hypothetical protein